MHHSPPSLLTRLRRHRGWWVLAMAVMLMKVFTGTVCLTDGPTTTFAFASNAVTCIDGQTASIADDVIADDATGCALGEPGDCHCACAHMATLPSATVPTIAKMDGNFDAPRIAQRFAPALAGSLNRPPIA